MKRGFTLIEIIIVLVIVAVIVGTAVLSIGTGLKSARLRDAARTVQMYVRHAKAVALLKQRPVVIQFETVDGEDGGAAKSRITISFSQDAEGESSGAVASGRGGGTDGLARTLWGAPVDEETAEAVPAAPTAPGDDEAKDPLMAEPREFEGIRLQAAVQEETVRRSRISVFSTSGALLEKQKSENEKAQARKAAATLESATKDAASTDPADSTAETTMEQGDGNFSVVYEANGRCEPFTVTVYKDGEDESRGITIKIDRFGKVVTEDD